MFIQILTVMCFESLQFMFNDRMPKDMESLVYNAAAEAKLYLVLKIIFLVTLTSRVTKSSSLYSHYS